MRLWASLAYGRIRLNGVHVMALGKLIDVTFKLDCLIREDKESKSFVSYCPALELYSAGRNRVEAREAIISAISMYLRISYERKVLGDLLHERNFQPADPKCMETMATASDSYIAIKERLANYDDEFRIEVPIHLLAQQQKISAQAV